MVAPMAVLQKQPSPVENQRLHRNVLFRGQFFQFPPKFRRDIYLDIHGLNGSLQGTPSGPLRADGGREPGVSPSARKEVSNDTSRKTEASHTADSSGLAAGANLGGIESVF